MSMQIKDAKMDMLEIAFFHIFPQNEDRMKEQRTLLIRGKHSVKHQLVRLDWVIILMECLRYSFL